MQPLRLLTCLVLPFDCHVGLPLSNTTGSTLLVCLVTDGFGLGWCFQWYMAGYPNSLLLVPLLCDKNQQSTWRDVLLEGLHTRTTPALMQYTKINYYAWFWLWTLVVVTSCTKKMCVWKSWWPIHTTNMACLTLWLQCRCTAITPKTNSTLLVGILLTDGLCLGYHFQWYTMGYAPQFTLEVHRNVLWYTTIHQEGWASCIESTSA
jgi:hypothetical protein